MAKQMALRRLVRSLWRAYVRWAKCDCVDLSAAFALRPHLLLSSCEAIDFNHFDLSGDWLFF